MWCGVGRLVLALLHLVASFAAPAAAQQPGFSGYYLNVATHVQGSVLGPAGASDVQRLRLMWNASPGPVRLDAAYEQTLTLRRKQAGLYLVLSLELMGLTGPFPAV